MKTMVIQHYYKIKVLIDRLITSFLIGFCVLIFSLRFIVGITTISTIHLILIVKFIIETSLLRRILRYVKLNESCCSYQESGINTRAY